MRMSCNGCRVLRKGCSESCSIRPCLQWIKNPESQANATVFLAKFYGRAGLMNLINAGPDHLRPDIFRSLLYEACGRMVNPIYGSVGLLWSGSWQLCQSAVDSVLRGSPIVSIPSEIAASTPAPPAKGYDIRHVCKESGGRGGGFPAELHRVGKCRTRFKRTGADPKTRSDSSPQVEASPAWSQESAGSHHENESMFSVETVEASHVSQGQPNHSEEGEMGLELTLGFEPMSRRGDDGRSLDGRWCEKASPAGEVDYGVDLELELAV